MDVAILHEEFVEGSALGHQVEMTMRMIMRMTMRMIMVMTMRMMTLIMRLATVEADNYQYDLEDDHNEVALCQHNIIVLTILFISALKVRMI